MGDLLLPNLMLGICNQRICVRVSRFWDFYDLNDETKLLHSDMVLVDEEGNNIHAQIYPAGNEHFKQLVKEGNVYNFSYFRVRNSSSSYKPVENDLQLSFSKWTKIEEVTNVPPGFPLYTYSIASMDQMQARLDKRVLCSDIIGVITAIGAVGAIQTKAKQSESTKRSVTICVPSGALLDVVLWGERATSFPAEQIHKDGEVSPQVVLFVGTLVKSYGGMSLTGGSSCKWYINPDIPEAVKLMASSKVVHAPITWACAMEKPAQKDAPEEKKVSDIIDLNPFEFKENEFLVNVTIKKIDGSWWYNACTKCMKTAKRHGNTYKCVNNRCGTIAAPTQRYKLTVVAGDETGDTKFILFGRQAQNLTKKTADTLVADNPPSFIPDEITCLLEKTFAWVVSFTESTLDSGNVTFQVNKVVGQINEGSAMIPATPEGSQASSYMLSGGASTSVLDTPQKSHAIARSSQPTASEASLASSTTPTKASVHASDPPETPQSGRHAACVKEKVLSSVVAAADSSSTKTQKNATNKRSRASPNKNVAKKLFINEDKDDNAASDSGVDAANQTSPSKDA